MFGHTIVSSCLSLVNWTWQLFTFTVSLSTDTEIILGSLPFPVTLYIFESIHINLSWALGKAPDNLYKHLMIL